MEQHQIAILACWYGHYPWYFPYFIHSCSYNPTIDFFIITDNHAAINNKPGNVKIIYKTLEEIKTTASGKLGFLVNIDNPYKLCDYKPAYGLIFEDYTKDYEFWGQTDVDVIYGNIRNFLTNGVLIKYDFISVRHDYTTGCFALYKNNTLMKNLFKKSKDYKTVFSNSQHYCFDECNFAWDELADGKSIFEVKTEIESFTHVIKTAEKNNEIKAHFDFILVEGLVGKIKFDNGKIVYKNRYEAILYHLVRLKQVYFPKNGYKKIPNIYCISPSRIYTK